jgi:non-canonical (house-cleaning) NTP pyrophosphatase
MIFGRVDSKRTGGSVGLLSGGLIDRTAYYEHAMVLALVPFMECNKDLF